MEEFKQCKLCQRSLPISYKDSICPACQERNLFNEVREFIRSHEVNEYEVKVEAYNCNEVIDIDSIIIKQIE